MKRRAIDNQKNHMIIINTWLFALGSVLVFYHWYQGIVTKNESLLVSITKLTANDGILLSTVAVMIGGLFYSIIILRPDLAKRQREKELLKLTMNATKHLDYTDLATGLSNQLYFEKTLETYLNEFKMTEEHLGLFVIDLAIEHPAPSMGLKEIGEILVTMSRDYDVVAKLDGKRFAIITPHIQSEDTDSILKRFNQSLSEKLDSGLSFSIGTADSVDKFTTAESIFKIANHNAILNRRLKFSA